MHKMTKSSREGVANTGLLRIIKANQALHQFTTLECFIEGWAPNALHFLQYHAPAKNYGGGDLLITKVTMGVGMKTMSLNLFYVDDFVKVL